MKKSELRALIREAIREQDGDIGSITDPLNTGSGGTAGVDADDQLGGATLASFDWVSWMGNFSLQVYSFPPPQSPCDFLQRRLSIFMGKFQRSLAAFNNPALQGGAYDNEFQMMYQNQLAFKLMVVASLMQAFQCNINLNEVSLAVVDRFLTSRQRSAIAANTRDVLAKYNQLRPQKEKPIKPTKPTRPTNIADPINVPSDGPMDTTTPVATGGRPIGVRPTTIRENEAITEAILNEQGYVCANPGSNACSWLTGFSKFAWGMQMTHKVTTQVSNPCNFIPKQIARMIAYRDSQVNVKGPDWKAILDYKISYLQTLGENPILGCEMGVTPEPGTMDI